jgi:hypothetical protein
MTLLTKLPQDATSIDVTPGWTAALRVGPADPSPQSADEATRGTAQDLYFFTSIEDFPPGIGDLSPTHDDVQGFYDYIRHSAHPMPGTAMVRSGSGSTRRRTTTTSTTRL